MKCGLTIILNIRDSCIFKPFIKLLSSFGMHFQIFATLTKYIVAISFRVHFFFAIQCLYFFSDVYLFLLTNVPTLRSMMMCCSCYSLQNEQT